MSPEEFEAWGSWVAIIVSIGIAIVGWVHANRANRRSNRAIELAEVAEQRADRLEQAQFDRKDVDWTAAHTSHQDRGTLRVTNIGADTAHEVVIIVDPEGAGGRRVLEVPSIDGGMHADVDLKDLSAEAERRFYSAPAGVLLSPGFTVRVRINWRSGTGVPGTRSWDEVHL